MGFPLCCSLKHLLVSMHWASCGQQDHYLDYGGQCCHRPVAHSWRRQCDAYLGHRRCAACLDIEKTWHPIQVASAQLEYTRAHFDGGCQFLREACSSLLSVWGHSVFAISLTTRG